MSTATSPVLILENRRGRTLYLIQLNSGYQRQRKLPMPLTNSYCCTS